MTPFECQKLLIRASLVDGRPVDESGATAQAWAGILEHLPLDRCIDALNRHYATSTDRIQPAHIIAIVRADHRQPRPVGEAIEAAGGQPAIGPGREQRGPSEPRQASAGYLAATRRLAEIQRAAGRPLPAFVEDRIQPEKVTPRDPLDVRCMYCQAAPGSPCVSKIPGRPRGADNPHESRIDAVLGKIARPDIGDTPLRSVPPTEGTSAA
jgi:hypothetical protein